MATSGWFGYLPLILKILLILEGIGVFAYFAAGGAGESFSDEKPSLKSVARIALLLPFYFLLLGVIACIAAGIVTGPFFALFSLLHWRAEFAVPVGIPLGILLLIGAFAVFTHWIERKSGEQKTVP